MPDRPSRDETRAFLLFYVLPVAVLLIARIAPFMTGARTLFLRDVFNAHLPLKTTGAAFLREGTVPLIDPLRAGGQPFAGNPNALPFYPDNLLYAAGSTLWALNAHFWIHLVLAPVAFFLLARALGLGRIASWSAALFYALSGYVLSQLAFYNLIAGAALAPVLAACCVHLAAGRRPAVAFPGAVVSWCLLVLAGDPMTALLGLGLAIAAMVAAGTPGARPARLRIVSAFACGTLLAAPQIVEFARIVSFSFRAHVGYSPDTRTAASLHPAQAIEWLLPFVFGRPDRLGPGGFFGERYYTGRPPFFFSLYPGILALALVPASFMLRDRVARVARWTAAAGLFLALGRYNPLAAWAMERGGGLLRYPIKFWMPVAAGTALLCGLTFAAFLDRDDRRTARAVFVALAALGLTVASAWILFARDGPAMIRLLLDRTPPLEASDIALESALRAGECRAVLLALILVAGSAVLARQRPGAGGPLLLFGHAAIQIVFLGPLFASDAAGNYLRPPPALAYVPSGSRVVSATNEDLFRGGPQGEPPVWEDGRALWTARRDFFDLQPFAGALFGRRYDLNLSPEGLDSFFAAAARDIVRTSSDADRVRLLRVWGVDRLLLDRDLEPGPERDAGGIAPLALLPRPGGALRVYAIGGTMPDVYFADRVIRARDLREAVAALKEPSFDPARTVVIPGAGDPVGGAPGAVTLVASGPERLSAEVEAGSAGVLVVQRDDLPLYRARVDGRPATVRVANLRRIGIDVPQGRHRVDLEVDRGPTRIAWLVSAAGCVLTAIAAWRLRRRELNAAAAGQPAAA